MKKYIFSGLLMKSESLRKKCPYSELLGSVFSRILTEYGEVRSISPYSVQMREITKEYRNRITNLSQQNRESSDSWQNLTMC